MNNKPAYCLHPLHFPVQLNALAKYTLHTKPYYNWMTLWRANSLTGIVATTIHQRSDLSSLRIVRWGKVLIHEVYPRWQKKTLPSFNIREHWRNESTDKIYLIQNWLPNNQYRPSIDWMNNVLQTFTDLDIENYESCVSNYTQWPKTHSMSYLSLGNN